MMSGTVLVTGGAGYIGSHTVRRLVRNGYQVAVFDNLSKGHRWAVPQDVPLIVGDIADTAHVAMTIRQFHVTSIIHFAACSLVGESMIEPRTYYTNNVIGTLHLLQLGCCLWRADHRSNRRGQRFGTDQCLWTHQGGHRGNPA